MASQNIRVSDGAHFASKNEIITWINNTLNVNIY